MPRPAYQPGHFYHIYNRGRSKLPICHDPRDYLDIIHKLKFYSQKYRIAVIAYVLLPNHYHLLVRQDDAPRASLLNHRVFNSYSKVYNKKYDHSGTIFQGVAKAKYVHNERYLLHLCRYIHANPVRHGLTNSINAWNYSNYHEWIGQREGKLIDKDFVGQYFESHEAYFAFVTSYLSRFE